MSTSAFTPAVLTLPASAAGSGQGELNLVTNPTATTDTTGWAAGAGATLGRGTGGGPLNPTVSTYFTTINTAGSESSTSGAYDVLTLPSGMQNRKLKVEFYFTSPAADTFKVSVYKGSTRVPLSTDSAGSTSLPQSTTGKFTAYFDTDSSGTWTVSVTRTAGTGSTALQFTNVVVGPGIQPQGAVVGPETVYPLTVGGSASAPTLGTNTSQAVYERIGDIMHIRYSLNQTTSGTAGSGTYLFSLPSGLTIDPSRLTATYQGSVGLGAVGTAAFTDGTKNYTGYAAVYNSTNLYLVVGNEVSTPSAMGSTTYSLAGATYRLSFEARVPIAEWAGSGTVQLAQNDVEYASNGNATNTSSDTATFVYGPAGSLVPNGATGTTYTRGVKFQTPVQASDRLFLEVNDGNGWSPIETRLGAFSTQNATSYGARLLPVSGDTTRYNVVFSSGGYESSGGSFGVNGAAWSGISSFLWRVRKSSAGAAVGFGLADTQSAGLVNPYTTGSGVVYSGTYTPTLTVVTGSASGTPQVAQYVRVGRVVTVSGVITGLSYTALSNVEFYITVPIARSANFANISNAGGALVWARGGVTVGSVVFQMHAKTTTANAITCFATAPSGTGAADVATYTFTYSLDF